jgi:HEPN domain-containing protein
MDSEEEAKYRIRLAEGYLSKANRFLKDRLFDDAVSRAQLASENAIKSIVSCFRVPSWTHDPSVELNEVIDLAGSTLREKLSDSFLIELKEAAKAAKELAPNHGKTTYGDTATHKAPWEIYDQKAANEAVTKASRAVNAAKKFIGEWFIE